MNQQRLPVVALVVDDEFLIAIELETILASSGCEVLAAVNVAEARRLAEERRIDIAVLDFRMGDGVVELAHALGARNVPLIFCTGSLPEEVHAVFPGATVIAKPFGDDQLLAAVAAALGQRETL